jgi:probable F420-dependent oxidoreductase
MVKVGITFPQTEIGSDPQQVRDFAQAAESLGYSFLLAYDHVLGANPERPDRMTGPYTYHHIFHEVITLFGYLAGLTERIELITGVLILPQRQTALVAKQAATVDNFSHGRLRLGVGIGWNHVEYEALGMNFHDRGKRVEEQIEVLRALWTRDLVTYRGKWHQISDAGINPLPVRRPIPIWLGGGTRADAGGDAVLDRVARLSDGWIIFGSADHLRSRIERMHERVRAAGRPKGSVPIMGGITIREGTPTDWVKHVKGWEASGATEVTVSTMGAGFHTDEEHIGAIRRLKAELG